MENRLPTALTAFVGRVPELTNLGRLLREARVVTITGPGGCGKTRLAVEAARMHLTDYADGACFADLSAVASPGLVASAVATAADLAATPVTDPEGLVQRLSSRTTLIVLDNCEHLAEEAASLVNALARGCPRLRILATSRQPLEAEAEWVYRIGGLSPPDSMKLFRDRAQQAGAAFELDERTAPIIAAICGRLDRLPLALELAAVHASAMAPADVTDTVKTSESDR